jgi:hypothetical protein
MRFSLKQLKEMGLEEVDGKLVKIHPISPAPTSGKPSIRMPKVPEPNKNEEACRYYLSRLWPMCDWVFEPFKLRLNSGFYTPDWLVTLKGALVCTIECKGSYRLHSATASFRAFKEAKVLYPFAKLVMAQWNESTWTFTENMNSVLPFHSK